MISVEMKLDMDSFKTEDVPASFVFEGMESIFKGTKKKQQKAKNNESWWAAFIKKNLPLLRWGWLISKTDKKKRSLT